MLVRALFSTIGAVMAMRQFHHLLRVHRVAADGHADLHRFAAGKVQFDGHRLALGQVDREALEADAQSL